MGVVADFLLQEETRMAKFMNADRKFFVEILGNEYKISMKQFEREMDFLAANSKETRSFDRVMKIGLLHDYLVMDRHSVGRYNTRILEHRDEGYIKKHNTLRDCPRFAPDLLAEKVYALLDAGAMRLMKAEDTPIYWDEDKEDVCSIRGDLTSFLVGWEGSLTKYLLAYSDRCVFILTVLNNENAGTDWENVKVIELPVPEDE